LLLLACKKDTFVERIAPSCTTVAAFDCRLEGHGFDRLALKSFYYFSYLSCTSWLLVNSPYTEFLFSPFRETFGVVIL
jgi:hypothetical protein